jgi:histone H3/H4
MEKLTDQNNSNPSSSSSVLFVPSSKPLERSNITMMSTVERIMKRILPSSIVIDNQALQTIANCSLEFMSSLACEALTNSKLEGKSISTGNDVLYSLRSLGYEDYVAPMNTFLLKHGMHSSICGICNSDPSFIADDGSTPATSTSAGKKEKKYKKRTLEEKKAAEGAITLAADGILAGDPKSKLQKLSHSSSSVELSPESLMKNNNTSVDEMPKKKYLTKKKKIEQEQQLQSQQQQQQQQQPQQQQQQKKKYVRKTNGPVKNWLDPKYVKELREKLSQALLEEHPTVFLKSLGKQLGMPYKMVFAQFDE